MKPDEISGKALIVRSGSEQYALDMMSVREVVYHPDITGLPLVSGFITGMCLWSGKQVPVADLGIFLGGKAPSSTGDLVITANDGKETGIMVDEIGPIVDLPLNSLISVDKNLSQEQGRVVRAFYHQGELVFIIETMTLTKNISS